MTRKTAEWLPALEAEDIFCAPVLDYQQVLVARAGARERLQGRDRPPAHRPHDGHPDADRLQRDAGGLDAAGAAARGAHGRGAAGVWVRGRGGGGVAAGARRVSASGVAALVLRASGRARTSFHRGRIAGLSLGLVLSYPPDWRRQRPEHNLSRVKLRDLRRR